MKTYSSLRKLLMALPILVPSGCGAANIPVVVCVSDSCKAGYVESLSLDFGPSGGFTAANAKRVVSFSNGHLSRVPGMVHTFDWYQANLPSTALQSPVLLYTEGTSVTSYHVNSFGIIYLGWKSQTPQFFFDLSLEKP